MQHFDLNPDASTEQVISLLQSEGVVRITDYHKDISTIKDELLSVFNKMEANYPYGKAIRSDNPESWNLSDTPSVVSFFRNSEWMFKVATGYQKLRAGFQRDIFSTYDYLHNNGVGPQGWAHFDRHQRFKFFLNITDVDEESGPLSVSPASHHLTRELRNAHPNPNDITKWRFGRFSGDPGHCDHWPDPQNHYPDIKYDLIPMTGPAGTLIIFDSNIIHKGGNVDPGKERIVVRSHSW